MTKTEIVKQHCKQLNLSALSNELDGVLVDAENEKINYLEFVKKLFETEIEHRMEKDKQRRVRQARLPLSFNLDLYVSQICC